MPYEVVAHNTATQSDNKIHDDEVARRFGFTGGLVPGVDVYAYLTHLPAETWGLDWLERGSMRGRFLTPVYEGETVTVDVVDHTEGDGGQRRVQPLDRRHRQLAQLRRGDLAGVEQASLLDGADPAQALVDQSTWRGA